MSLKVFQCRALGWLHTLYARLAKNIKFEILGYLEVSSAWMASYYVYRVSEKYQVRNFWAAWKRLRIVNKGRTFSYKYFFNFEEKYGKKRAAGRLIISSLVTSLQER